MATLILLANLRGGGGGGAVSSVQGKTGTVALTADDIPDGTTSKAYPAVDKTKLAGIATGATANAADAVLEARANHTGTQSADTLTDGTTNKAFLATERTKLGGVATGATANSSDAILEARANHTGTQTASTISDFSTAADARVVAGITGKADATALTAEVTNRTNADTTEVTNRNTAIATETTRATTAEALLAPLASPTFTGDPKAPTPAKGDSDTSIATTAFVAANSQPYRKPAKYIDTISGFFGPNGYFWSGGQRTTTTTLTSAISAGASVLPVADATGIVAGMSLLLLAGTSSQKVVQVLSVASLNVTLTSGTGVPAMSSGATVAPLWADSVHLTDTGFTGIAYAVFNAKNANGTDVFSVASGERVTLLGNSWFQLARDTPPDEWAAQITAKFPGALVTNVGVGGDHGSNLIARFATDVPTDSKYVVFNEPGGNSLGVDSMATIVGQLATLVRLCQGIGAIPVYTGAAPLSSFTVAAGAMITDLFRDGFSIAAADAITAFTDHALSIWYPGLADYTSAATFTNKRITKRVYANTTATSWTIAGDSFDVATLTALASALTINAPSGTPTSGQPLVIRIKDNATARALTWNAVFRVVGTTLPTTTVVSKTVYVGCIYNADDSKWDVVAVAQEA